MRTISELSDLGDRVAVVVGGAGHIGRTAAQALAELGATVAVADVEEVAARRTARELTDAGGSAGHYPVDLADEAATRALPERVVADHGRLDILVHTAALVGTSELPGWATPFADQSSATWRASLDVNLTSAFVLAQASADALGRHGAGSVVLVGSIYGLVGPDLRLYEGTGMGNPAAYAAAKGGLVSLTRWLATALAPDVRVNMCSPGGVARGQDDRFVSAYVDRTPMRRMATEEDLKGAMAFLASDLSAYVTGHNLVVDGGWTTW